jgi:hypothetical protein
MRFDISSHPWGTLSVALQGVEIPQILESEPQLSKIHAIHFPTFIRYSLTQPATFAAPRAKKTHLLIKKYCAANYCRFFSTISNKRLKFYKPRPNH